MKKINLLLVITAICLSIVACDGKNAEDINIDNTNTQVSDSPTENNNKIQVTIYDESTKQTYTATTDTNEPIIIGRSVSSDIVLSDNNYVSRTHCQLTFHDDKIYLLDLDSTNGTFIFIEEEWVQINDEVEIKVGEQFQVANKILTLQNCKIE